MLPTLCDNIFPILGCREPSYSRSNKTFYFLFDYGFFYFVRFPNLFAKALMSLKFYLTKKLRVKIRRWEKKWSHMFNGRIFYMIVSLKTKIIGPISIFLNMSITTSPWVFMRKWFSPIVFRREG